MPKEPKNASKLAGIAFDEALERLARTGPAETNAAASLGVNTIDRLITRFEDAAHTDDDGIEYWDARDLQDLLGYSKWDSFLDVVGKAQDACNQSGQPIENHFADVRKMVSIGSGAEREVLDIRLTRYACYLIAQNGDSRKKSIAFSQTYFAIQTRRQELQDEEADQYAPLSEDEKRIWLRNEIKDHNTKLASAAKGAGVITGLDFAIFQNKGYEGLYGGLDKRGIQRIKGLAKKDAILDHMGSTELAANLFRATQTEEKLKRDNIKGKEAANQTHYTVGKKVRQAIADIGGTRPEWLPTAENITKVERRMKKTLPNPAAPKLPKGK